MAHQMKMSNISFSKDLSASSDMILCSENQIKQACIAILLNSFEAVGEQGEIRIRTKDQGESKIKLEFTDNGVGITADDIPHIFEPFFSAKNKSTGIGLGLAIVHGIIQGHNGKIKVQSDPGIKTSVSIILPLVKN